MIRDITTLLTSEMTQEEWTEFRKQWIEQEVTGLMVECGMELEDAEFRADIDFESYVGQEGFTGRDERLADARRAPSRKYEMCVEQ